MGQLVAFVMLFFYNATSLSNEELVSKADSIYNLGRYKQAHLYYKRAIEKGVRDYKVFAHEGLILYSLGKEDEALQCFIEASKLEPDSPYVWYALGSLYEEVGNRQEAIECLKKSVDMRPDFYDAWNNLGVIYRREGQEKLALNCYRKALSGSLDDTTTLFNIGALFEDMGEIDSAIYYYKRSALLEFDSCSLGLLDSILNFFSFNIDTFRFLVNSMRNFKGEKKSYIWGWLAEALAFADSSLIVNMQVPTERACLAIHAALKSAQDNPFDAYPIVRNICGNIDFNDCFSICGVEAENSLGALRILLEDLRVADQFLPFAQKKEENETIFRYATRCLTLGGDCTDYILPKLLKESELDSFIGVFKSLSELVPNSPYVYSALAQLHEKKNDITSAMENYEKALLYFTDKKRASNDKIRLAKLYVRAGNKDRAVSMLKDLLDVSPSLKERIIFDDDFSLLFSDPEFLDFILGEPILPEEK